jgi:hypothetical protein
MARKPEKPVAPCAVCGREDKPVTDWNYIFRRHDGRRYPTIWVCPACFNQRDAETGPVPMVSRPPAPAGGGGAWR